MSSTSSKKKLHKYFDQNSVGSWSFDAIVKYIVDQNLASEALNATNMATKALQGVMKNSTIEDKILKAKQILDTIRKADQTDQQASTVTMPEVGITIKTKDVQINQSHIENIYNNSKITKVTSSSNEKENPEIAIKIAASQNGIANDQKEESQSRKTDKKRNMSSCSSNGREEKYRYIEMNNNMEFDGIMIPDTDKSLATIMKQGAVNLHKIFVKNKKLDVKDRKIMSTGLSSIVDLVDQRDDGQRKFFTATQWLYINSLYTNLKIQTAEEVESSVDVWTIVTKTCQGAGSVRLGETYLTNIRNKNSADHKFKLECKAMEHMLELIETKTDMLAQRKMFTESDYLRVIWSPILERLFPPPLRVISGESIFAYTTRQKQATYFDTSSVKGFKIDLRFVGDKNGTTYDLGAAECGKDGSESKLLHDEGKLVREGKDVVDCLLETLHESNHKHVMSWQVQIDAAEVKVSTVHLVANGMYVAYPQFEFDLPTSVDDMDKFEEALKAFITMREHMMKVYSRLSTDGHKNEVMKKTFKHAEDSEDNNCGIDTRMRGTWYTPTHPTRSRLPEPLFGKASPFDLNRRLIQARNEELLDDNNEKANVDVYGWTEKDNKWYNIHTKKFADHHPHHPPPRNN